MSMFIVQGNPLTKKVFAEQVDRGSGFNLYIPLNARHTGQTHRFFIANVCKAWKRIRHGSRDGSFKFYLFPDGERIRILHPLRHIHPTGATHAKSVAIEERV